MLQENTCLFLNRQVRLSIKWTETHQIKYNKPFCLPCQWRWQHEVLTERFQQKNSGKDIESLPLFGVFRFLLRGGTVVQHPFARKRNSVPFLEV